MTGIYRWFINETQVYPTYKSDLSKDIEKETNQMFFRPKLNGKLRFKRDDYDFLNDSSFETEFILTCERFYEGIWQFDYKSRFMKTDCIWDIDHEVVEVTVETLDNYNKILAGQEKEFDLIKLNPAITALLLDKRPLIQIYSPSDDVVSCFIGGIYWEQPVKTVVDSESDLVNIYKFAQSTSMRKATLTNTLTPVIDVSGLYIGRSDDNMNRDLYRIEERYYTGTITGYGYSIVRNLDNVELYVCDTIYVSPVTVGVLTFRELSTDITNVSASFQSYHIYMRLLLDLPGTDTFRTLDIFPIPTDDILADNRNYRSVCPYQFDCIFINQLTSDTPTEYGKTDSGKYFIEPVSLLFPKFYPVARSQWGNTSLWFHYPIEDPTIDKEGRTLYTLKNNYKISDVIIALLKEIDTDIVHENDPDYSKFLYDQTGNPVYGDWFEVMITPKSNLRNGDGFRYVKGCFSMLVVH